MSSHSQVAPRRIPQQQRGERRVNALLDAADEVISESGYEAAAMNEIAERAGASIGSLYQFFPNKAAVAHALCQRYGADFEAALAPIEADARNSSLEDFVHRLIDMTVEFVDRHAALHALLDAPLSARKAPDIAMRIEEQLARFLLIRKPRISKKKAFRLARVVLGIIKGMNVVYLETQMQERSQLVAEFKTALLCFLTLRIGPNSQAKG